MSGIEIDGVFVFMRKPKPKEGDRKPPTREELAAGLEKALLESLPEAVPTCLYGRLPFDKLLWAQARNNGVKRLVREFSQKYAGLISWEKLGEKMPEENA